jgi:hypothetical protein
VDRFLNMSSAEEQRMVISSINSNQPMAGDHDAGCARPMCAGFEHAGMA